MAESESLIKAEEQPLDLSRYSEQEKKRIDEIAEEINTGDSQAVVVYGVGAQRDISSFSDTILSEVRSRDTGEIGTVLTDLVVNIKDLDVDSLGEESFLSKIPILGGLVDRMKHFIEKYQKVSVQIDHIANELDKARTQLLKDIGMLDTMYEKNTEYFRNLELHIVAGQMKIKELREKVLPELEEKVKESNDPLETQKLQDLSQFINRFEKKLHDLQLSRMIALQTAPQIRLIQQGNQQLVEKIQSSILNTLPLWKNQIVIAITLFRQKKAVTLQREVSETTNEILQRNAEMLKQSGTEVARESERGIVDIETLKKVNADLISTIEDTLRIQEEGRSKRRQAEGELVKIEQDLKNKLAEVRN